MYKHFIIISDSYSQKLRIGYKETKVSTDKDLLRNISEITNTLKVNNVASYSTYLIETDEPSWRSIIDSDLFFKGILISNDINDFVAYINEEHEYDDRKMASERLYKSIKKLDKKIPIQKLETRKQIEQWFDDKSQDY